MGFERTTCRSHDARKPIIRQKPFQDMATDKAGGAGDQDSGHQFAFRGRSRTTFSLLLRDFVEPDIDVVRQ